MDTLIPVVVAKIFQKTEVSVCFCEGPHRYLMVDLLYVGMADSALPGLHHCYSPFCIFKSIPDKLMSRQQRWISYSTDLNFVVSFAFWFVF